MKTIGLFMTALIALFGISTLVVGIITGGWHLYLIAIMALVLAYAVSSDGMEDIK